MKIAWAIIALGMGVATVPVIWGRPLPAPISFALSLSSDGLIPEKAAIERCEAVIKLATRAGQIPQIDPTAEGPRAPLGNARTVKVLFPAKNSRGVDLQYAGWCRVWSDGKTAIVRLIETAGRDLLASSQLPSVRDAYLERVKISKMETGLEGFSYAVTNRNEFAIRSAEVNCRIHYAGSNGGGESTVRIERIIPGGGSSKFNLPRSAGAQSVTCRVTDFLRISSAEQRLIEVFGSAGSQASLARLRQDAIRVGVSVDTLVEPYITLTKALASVRR